MNYTISYFIDDIEIKWSTTFWEGLESELIKLYDKGITNVNITTSKK